MSAVIIQNIQFKIYLIQIINYHLFLLYIDLFLNIIIIENTLQQATVISSFFNIWYMNIFKIAFYFKRLFG